MSTPDQDRRYIQLGLRIVGEFGAIIAVPVVLLTILGRHADSRYGTAPAGLIAGFVLAALFSGVSIYRRAKRFGREYQAIDADPTTPQTEGEKGKPERTIKP
ncbi:hypothetical protein COY93_02780 [Candidatus Uhrbacteria bacterium CG_4_10_14_0_8_um_filter_58_22]|uniref:AtpZ/AtpI family protein n=1 Tax=Candidatus Uhrbacteria bacterium CG_4_10_14_0_8_um_filter_58_22 TaxID=1975029 RepID=A0A2M7Q9T6_9BACT|nr:MAG: hypothetical protein AUJ19_00215 [Parcubacteria group bacterium CG1_02_58_44]PIY62601.1 MAG: hypothetical protein COY93_02780 [Candidatus Uhrbacteria bacterium CG_4_10_14_0_8_um_filter_58_22]